MQNKVITISIGLLIGLICGFCCAAFGFLYYLISIPKPEVIPSDFSVTLERGPCFGFCPMYKVTVDGSGEVVYEGENFVASKGTKQYSIGIKSVFDLYKNIKDIKFFDLENRYEDPNITDLPSYTITVKANGQEKEIYVYGLEDSTPKNLNDLAEMIDEVAETDILVK